MARLRPVLAITVLGTPVQILLTVGLGLGVGHLLGLAFVQSLWLGCLLSLSSTMVTLKLLTDHGFSKALSGQVMLEIHDSANSCTFLASCRKHTPLHLSRFIPLPSDYTDLVWAKKKLENSRVITQVHLSDFESIIC